GHRMLRTRLALAFLLVAAPAASHAQDWIPSKWGAGDTLGAVNEITPEVVLNAVKVVTEGKRYALGQITSRETPASGTRMFELFVFGAGADGLGAPIGTNEFNFFDDWMLTYMGVGSQIDGLGHAAIGDVFYNGWKSKDFFRSDGLTKMGIEELPPIVTRGVVLDMVSYFKAHHPEAVITRGGVEMLAGGTVFNRAEIEGAAARQGVEFMKGDVVL
ncbi:MAG: cyclase family protein, partial [Akkermansiaceae bacterium]|nr:cyclase family protein [Akkermansiaceae bacterium]